ncbi:MAG: N-acetylglutaminylglutamine amidotransferase [Candidatus Berkiella sp.]
MCGIAGEIRFDGTIPEVKTLQRICNAMENRGPDNSGIIQHGSIALGHRRLKIFDLSEHGQQPMFDPHLGLAAVFNGAIYNFPELKSKLKKQGYRFFSKTDTEIIIKAYHAWGKQCVEHFNGMFAIVIWDREKNEFVLFRDRLGIKPIYYTMNNHFFRFASTLPALLKGGEIETSINPESLHYYLMFHVVPEHLTLLKGVKKLKPATVMTISSDRTVEEYTYWDSKIVSGEVQNKTEDEWVHDFSNLLKKSIKRQSMADVPIGLLLSGGLDSSLLAAILAQELNGNLNTFSIGFESSGGIAGDEFFYSDIIAQRFSANHTKILIKNNELLETLDECIAEMSEPMTSHDNPGFFLLSKEVSKHVKVVQSGQGADEIFAGYHWFQKCAKIAPYEKPVNFYVSNVLDRTYHEYCDVVTNDYRTDNFSYDIVDNYFSKNGSQSLVDNALYLDSTFPLAEGPLKRVDNMTMAWSLESRVPFLDHELVEFSAQMPLSLKMKDNGKYILKKLAKSLLPSEVIDRPKGYFPVPALKSIEGNYLTRIQDVLKPTQVLNRGLFELDYIQKLLSAPKSHQTPLGESKLWQIAVLEMWLQNHNIS